MTADRATSAMCATRWVSGAGIVRRAYTAPADGFLTARLSGPADSNWDLAVLDRRTHRTLNGSAAFGSDEQASATVPRGQTVAVQACRRSGAARSVRLELAFAATDFAAQKREADATDLQLVRIDARTPADLARLRALGIDLTDHPGPTGQDAYLWSKADADKLRDAGFDYRVRQRDVLAQDRRDRRVEVRERGKRGARARGAQAEAPGRRTAYRTLAEHQQALKELIARAPTLVRPVTLPGKTVDGRDIVGVEIAENVGRPDDGRPVYVQVGTHHAREWPAAEATTDFGIDLVNGYLGGDRA